MLGASAYWSIGRYRRSKHRKLTTLEVSGRSDTPLQQLTWTITLTLNPNFFCTKDAPFATRNKRKFSIILLQLSLRRLPILPKSTYNYSIFNYYYYYLFFSSV